MNEEKMEELINLLKDDNGPLLSPILGELRKISEEMEKIRIEMEKIRYSAGKIEEKYRWTGPRR